MKSIDDNHELLERVRKLYKSGSIDADTAKSMLDEFFKEHNKKAVEIAKKHKVKPKFLSFNSLMR